MLRNVVLFIAPFMLVATVKGQGVSCPQGSSCQVTRTRRTAEWHSAKTANFAVYCCAPSDIVENLAQRCESLQAELQRHWFDSSPKEVWCPPCDVVVHPTRESYAKAAGEGGWQSTGVSYVEVRGGAIAVRRIDLYGGQTGYETAALPHELTHIVFADRFHDRRIPPWADEGAAVLADAVGKQKLHLRDLEAALTGNTTFDLRHLLALECCPANAQCGTFYGQSLSLVDFLVRRGGPRRFVTFLSQATRSGYDLALKESYGIRGVDELDRLWREHASSPKRPRDVVHDFGPAEQAGLLAHGDTPGF